MSRIVRVLAALLALALVGPVAARSRRAVVVQPLKGLGVDHDTAGRLDEVLRAEIAKVPGVRLVGEARTLEAVGEAPCGGQPACLSALAKRAGAATAIYGVVGALGEVQTLTLKAVDARSGKTVARVEDTLGGERAVLIEGLRAAAFRLLRPDLFTGSLDLRVPVEGAEVQVDGRTVGTTPLAGPVKDLAPGQHALKIVKKGFSDFDKFVQVRFQRTTVVTVDLGGSTVSGVLYRETPPPLVEWAGAEEPEPGAVALEPLVAPEADAGPAGAPAAAPLPSTEAATPPAQGPSGLRWTGYALLASGVVSAGAGLGFGLDARDRADTLTARFDAGGGPTAADTSDYTAMRGAEGTANVLYGVGGALAVAGAAAVLWDVLAGRGARAPGDAPDVSLLPAAPGGLGLTLTVVR